MNLRRRGIISIATTASLLAAGVFSATAGAAPIDDKRREAAAIQDQIDVNGEKIATFAEKFNQANIQLQEAQAGIDAATAKIAEHQVNTADLERRARARAVVLYQRGSDTNLIAAGTATSANEMAAADHYMRAATLSDDDLVDQLRQATAEQKLLTSNLRDVQRQARTEQANIESAKTELEKLNALQTAVLSKVKGELAVLVEAERVAREKAAAEAYQRQQEAARQRAAERAAAKAASDATSTTTSKKSATTTAAKPADGSGTTTTTTTAAGGPPATTPPKPQPPTGNPARVQTVINFLYAQLGKPYVYGSAGPDSYDCSGLVMRALESVGISTPHGATAQGTMFPQVTPDQAQPGDIFMFSGGGHDGIYIGNGQMIHAPQTGDVVKISPAYRTSLTRVSRPPY